MFLISIRALREEGDSGESAYTAKRGISIHALREEGDFCFHAPVVFSPIFLSTPSARRATHLYTPF